MALNSLLYKALNAVILALLVSNLSRFYENTDETARNVQNLSQVKSWKSCILIDDSSCEETPIVAWRGIKAEGAGTIAEAIGSRGRPIILVDTPANNWTSLHGHLSNASSFGRLVGMDNEIKHVYKATDKDVLYHNPAMPMAKSRILKWSPTFSHSDLKASELVQHVSNLTKGIMTEDQLHYYYSASVFSEDCLKALANVLPDLSMFTMPLSHYQTQNNTQVHVWIGGENITTLMHYDTYHNFYIQFSGKKVFHLYPPSHWPLLRLYPALHPSARQTQFSSAEYNELLESSQSTHQKANRESQHIDKHQRSLPNPQVVILEPGQVLYLPPYWFHRVTSLGESLSLNVWTDSNFGVVESEHMFAKAVPFATDKRWSDLAVDIAVLRMVVLFLHRVSNASDVLLNVLNSQFKPLKLLEKDDFKPSQTHIVNQLACTTVWDKTHELPAPLNDSVDHQVTHLISLMDAFTDPGIYSIVIGNFVQALANWSTRDVDKVAPYMKCVRYLLDNLSWE